MVEEVNVKHALIDEDSIFDLAQSQVAEKIKDVRFLTRGLNDTYKVVGKESFYAYRIYRHGWRNEAAIKFELDAILHLKNKGYEAVGPVQETGGLCVKKIVAPEGDRYGVLFSFAEGERPAINPENTYLIGKSLGRLHRLSNGFTSEHKRGYSIDLTHLLDEPASFIRPILKRYLGETAVEVLNETVRYIKEKLETANLETGFCHGDFHNHNMHLYKGALQVFDFDSCAIGYRAYDVAVAWWNLLHNYKQEEKECWNTFLQGYEQEYSLGEENKKALPLFITTRRIWLLGTMLQNRDVWGTNWIDETALELFILQLKTDRMGMSKDWES
ncbi:phosphotransferase [Oceanobacillus jordanicus]|uniref:Phosphotransferase n=1 Tax=Oceanobacillus jordanicus TaxID=2867266 RepID=A0AAW5B2T9_9BACI|nr:phosphotransferase [Oceanobacillus jordanicus]MCG3418567.1 phosphotransferase [Oceanobacillus jordanicus]